MDEYPKLMRLDFLRCTVTATAPPGPDGFQPFYDERGCWGTSAALRPLPSPDDEVEVVVRMTRAQRDYIAGTVPVMSRDRWSPVVGACRAHRDAEQAEGGTE